MRYTTHTDEELNRLNLLSPGIHDFEVMETDDKPSKKGNDMVTLKLHVFEDDGTPRIVFDYLVPEAMPHKFKHACDACNLLAEYEAGSITAASFLGRTGKLTIFTQPAKDNFQEKSAVKDYVKREVQDASAPPPARKAATDLDDEIPF